MIERAGGKLLGAPLSWSWLTSRVVNGYRRRAGRIVDQLRQFTLGDERETLRTGVEAASRERLGIGSGWAAETPKHHRQRRLLELSLTDPQIDGVVTQPEFLMEKIDVRLDPPVVDLLMTMPKEALDSLWQ